MHKEGIFFSLFPSPLCGFFPLWLKKCKSLRAQALAKDKPQRQETTEGGKREREKFLSSLEGQRSVIL